jgi:hypothetical protein
MLDGPLSTSQKALQINLDANRYGTFAEIGAGQEVARWFFQAGGAAGTVAKTISAYDMEISDAMYGQADRYVSRQRLRAMLAHEYGLLVERLQPTRGDRTAFFAFANTVATRSYTRPAEGHGWMGIRFQEHPHEETSEILVHVRMLDKENLRQQEALGIVGVNLVHGAFYLHHDPPALIRSLLDNLTWERVEADMIRVSGPSFAGIDNRLMALQLVRQGLTEAAVFTAEGEAVQLAEVLHNRPVLVQRGSFRPVTNATLDVMLGALERFVRDPAVVGQTPAVLMEMTLRHLTTGDAIDHSDFLARADTLGGLGQTVLVSNFRRYHRLAAYLARYTNRPLGIAMGASKLREILDESFYNTAEGGLLGGLGQLLKNPTRLYVYPSQEVGTGEVLTAANLQVPAGLRHLQAYLLANQFLEDLAPSSPELPAIRSHDVLALLQAGDPAWEQYVPTAVGWVIKERGLFGWPAPR